MPELWAIALMLAQADQDPLNHPLTQFGLLGVVLGAFIAGARYVYKAEKARADRLEAELRDINSYLRDRAIPTLEAVTKSNADTAQSNGEVAKVLGQVVMLLHGNQR